MSAYALTNDYATEAAHFVRRDAKLARSREVKVFPRVNTHEPGSQRSDVVRQLAPSKQTRHAAPVPSQGAAGKLSGRTERERIGVVK